MVAVANREPAITDEQHLSGRRASDLRDVSLSRRPRVVTILPRGEAIRNFVYTGALDKLGAAADVTLLSVIPSAELHELLSSRCEQTMQLAEIRERWLVGYLRDILDVAHGRWLWSEAARQRWQLRDKEANTPGKRLKRRAQKAACYPFASRKGLRVLTQLERTTSRWLRTTDEYLRLFKQLKPALVFNGSHVHSRIAVQPVQAAQWLGIPTATFIFSWDNLTSQGRVIPEYDYYLVWNEAIREQLLQIYDSVRPEQVFVTGTPQFDFHFRPEFYWTREEFCARVGADPRRPIVLYSTGMANHVIGEPHVVESLAAMLRGLTEFGPPQLLVREYAKGPTGIFDELKRRCPDILFPPVLWEREWLTPKLEDSYLLTNMLRHASVGINVASTISLELCMFDKPVINVGYKPANLKLKEGEFDYCRYYEFEHYRPVVQSGAIKVARSDEEMRTLLAAALAAPQTESALRQRLIKRMFGNTLDGQTGARLAAKLLELAHAHEPHGA